MDHGKNFRCGQTEIRNRILSPIFKDLKLIEAWGTGIQKMRNEVRVYPEIELVLQETGHAFQVLFRKKEPTGAKLEPSTGQVSAQVAGQVGGRVSRHSRLGRPWLSGMATPRPRMSG